MGLFDRFLKGGAGTSSNNNTPKPKKEVETFFLDADSSGSMGNVDFMRRSNTIRRTFPGTVDNPGNKEMVAEVASMEASVEKLSDGMPGSNPVEAEVSLNAGIPKPVKKTFAQTMSAAELDQRKKGSAVGVNVTGGPAAIKMEQEAAAADITVQQQINRGPTQKPGAIDPFKQMAKDLNG
ncbi:hypothetical protein [Cyanobium sp. WAJ14-Wanaka]|uniref:hypothetical protein n=1 Tax=Cyanobium sp. WAJ14-Wanaka TaxID=2823725 RepID=UPI0020CDF0D3|nr:hypothetical protein [Cyanobium sp. WAJ14-Wanaka]MCP9774535.1 hypothetical protein [Cyanobium sp. WAJ14-Wanaka]